MEGLRPLGRWLCVAVCFGVSLPLCAQTADERFQVAADHYSRGWYERAAEGFRQFAAAFPEDARLSDARFYEGEAALAAESFDAAREAFEALIDLRPAEDRLAHAEFRLAEIAFRQERFDEAAERYADFVAARPEHSLLPNAAMQAGHAHWRRGELGDAEAAYREGLTRAKSEAVAQEFRLALARTYAAMGREVDAIRFYETVLASPPADVPASDLRRELGERRFAAGEYARAAEEFAVAFAATSDPAARKAVAERLVEAQVRAENWTGVCDFAASDAGQAALEESPAALLQYAAALSRLDRSEEAADVRRRLLEGDRPEEVRAAALRQLALAAFDRGDVDEAIELCERHAAFVGAADPDAALRSRWARACMATGEAVQAEKLLAECLALKALSPETRGYLIHDLGVAIARQDDPQRALAAFRQAPGDLPPELASAIALAAADAAAYAGDWRSAEEYLRQRLSLAESGGDEETRRRLFVAVANQGTDDAEAARLLRTLPTDAEADAFFWNALDRFLQRAEREAPERFAEFAALRQTEAAPESLRARSQALIGFQELAEGDAKRAEAAFDAADGLAADGPVARDVAWGRAELAAAQGDLQKVDEQIDRLRSLGAGESRLRQASLIRSRCARHAGDVEESAAELQRLIAALDADENRTPEDAALLPLALFDLGERLAELGRDDEATTALERLLKEHAASTLAADSLYRLAERAYRLGRTEECETLLARLLEARPRAELIEHALYLRGQNASRADAWDRVAESMTSLIETAPQSSLRFEAEYWIAEAKFRQKDFADAGARFDALAETMQTNEPAWKGMIPLRRAQILAAGSNFAEALSLLTNFDERFPEFRQRHEVEYLRGRCLARLGRFEEARGAFDAAIRSPWSGAGEIAAMAQWMIGETYFHQERFAEAIAAYELVEARYDFPRWQATALLQAGKCYERLNRNDEAARNYAYLLKNYGDTPPAEEASRRLRATSNRPRQALRQADTRS